MTDITRVYERVGEVGAKVELVLDLVQVVDSRTHALSQRVEANTTRINSFDAVGHQQSHVYMEQMIKEQQARALFWSRLRDKVTVSGVIAVMGFLALALMTGIWEIIRSHLA